MREKEQKDGRNGHVSAVHRRESRHWYWGPGTSTALSITVFTLQLCVTACAVRTSHDFVPLQGCFSNEMNGLSATARRQR